MAQPILLLCPFFLVFALEPEDSEIDQHCARATFPDRSVSTPLGLKSLWFGDCLVTVAVHIKIWQIWSDWGELEIPKQKCESVEPIYFHASLPASKKNTQMEIKALAPNHSGRTGDVTPKRSFLWNDSCLNVFYADEILIVAKFSWPCWELMFNLRLPIHHPTRWQQQKSAGRWFVFALSQCPCKLGEDETQVHAMSGPSLVLKCFKWVAQAARPSTVRYFAGESQHW